jgi:hypothetical protein
MKKTKGYMAGGKTKGYKKGGKLKMVEKDGKEVPFFMAKEGGKMPGVPMTTKMMAKGGKTKGAARGGVRGSGAARPQQFMKNG